MLTIHGVPPGEPVLTGPLRMHRLGPIRGRPVAVREPWCAWCRERHSVAWPDPPFPPDLVVSLLAPCRRGPLAGRAVWVALEDVRRAEQCRMIRALAQSLRRWRVERRLRLGSSESRALDQAHLRDWPDSAP
jgi:hypothetical protein